MDAFEEQEDHEEADEESGGRVAPEEARAAHCRRLALRTLQRFGITTPPVPVELIAQRLGFVVRTCKLQKGVDARIVSSVAGMFIEVAADQPRVRQRFSIGHEIGHHLLGHRHGESGVAELQASLFANAILAPGPWLAKDLARYPTAAALAARYEVSSEVIFIAARHARLLAKLR